MPVSVNPTASYHLCLDFSTAPPDNGPLKLGSILKNLDIDGLAPVNENSHIKVEEEVCWPRNGPDMKKGLKFSMNDLKTADFGIWAKVFGAEGLGGKISWLSNWSSDEELTIEALNTRYFNPTTEYMTKVLESAEVVARLNVTKKKLPLYMITGLKWVEGASLSKKKAKSASVTGEVGATGPHSGTSAGGKVSYTSEETASASFEESTDFVLGYRLRMISWKRGLMKISDKVAGRVLDIASKTATSEVLDGIDYVDDFTGQEDMDEAIAAGKILVVDEDGSIGTSVWVLP
ncbi:hypothetical protein BP6252_01820 [Coleophoma cylindrospora]|uniref:Uncharacterized protein n=1 Tax=Coleophoma cylindrospora TaxID=1849047 RepID=A0A3D8SD16_9HELO|nr:hypothetical protein BP6252_01820 [Coleophoma cylindrospora]